MKFFILSALAVMSFSLNAEENSCANKCQSNANQTSLSCHKMSQICYRMGQAESLPFELCMEETYTCVLESRAKLEVCLKACADN